MKIRPNSQLWVPLLFLLLSVMVPGKGWSAESTEKPNPTLSDRLANTTETVKTEAAAAGRDTAEELEHWWTHIEQYRLKNRSAHEIVAWVLVGLMVGGLAGSIATFRRKGLGPVRNIAVGLVGAFLGGLVVHLTRWDLGWGPVLIRYEEVAAALIGSVLVVLIFRFLTRTPKKPEAP